MRAARVIVCLLITLVLAAGCGIISGGQGGVSTPSPAPLDDEGYGEVQLLATISGDFLPSPSGVAVNQNGQVFVTDDSLQTILGFANDDYKGPAIKIGDEGSGFGQFIHPREIAIGKEGHLYVLDDGNSRVQKLTSDGQSTEVLAVFGSREDFSPYFSLGDGYDEPLSAMAVDDDGNVYVGLSGANYDISPHALIKYAPDGEKMWEIKSTLEGDIDLVPFAWPNGLTIDPDGNIYVAHGANGVGKIWILPQQNGMPTKDDSANFASIGKGPGELMHTPGSLVLLPGGDLLVADTYNNRLQMFSVSGTLKAMYRLKDVATDEFDHPTALALAPDGNVFVVDSGNKRVLKLCLLPPAPPEQPPVSG